MPYCRSSHVQGISLCDETCSEFRKSRLASCRKVIHMRRICIALVVAVIGFGLVHAQGTWRGISEKVGEEAIKRTSLLKPGMLEETVFKTLDLQKFGLKARSSGSGPRNAWPTWYMVTERRSIMIRWNLQSNPPTLVSVQVIPINRKDHVRN